MLKSIAKQLLHVYTDVCETLWENLKISASSPMFLVHSLIKTWKGIIDAPFLPHNENIY